MKRAKSTQLSLASNIATVQKMFAGNRSVWALCLRRIMASETIGTEAEAHMPAKKLSDGEVQQRLKKANGWSLVNGKLHREFQCKDFVAAFGNMTRVALVAESMNHHPEWFNVWNKVVIDLNTHSVKGISDYDFTLAEKINEIFG